MKFKDINVKLLGIIFLVAYLSMYFLIVKLPNFGNIQVFNNYFPASSIKGSINASILGLTLVMIIITNGKLYVESLFLQGVHVLWVVVSIVASKNLAALPGLCTTTISILLSTLIMLYLKKIKLNEIALDKAVYVDVLTNCLNRRGLLRELELKASMGKKFYLVFLDLDNFKQVNDTFGHDAGDELLLETANKWSAIKTQDNYILARLGGDEFAIIIETSKTGIIKFMNTLMTTTKCSSSKFGSYVSTSAGVAHFCDDTSDINQLLVYADTAMYKAKTSGKDAYVIFSKSMYEELAKRYLTEGDLRAALKANEFVLLYQPQYDVSGKNVVGYETLLRMYNKERDSFVNTQMFINIAEKSNLIYDIDMWVLKNALLQTKGLVDSKPNIDVSINVSGKHLMVDGFVDSVLDILIFTKFNPQNLKLEITESSYIRNINDAMLVINRLKLLGIKIALDDFGTGYSSLNYLSKIPVDTLKIDKSFIDEMLFNTQHTNFIDIIIKLGHLMNCKVLAEGVEDEEQVEILETLGCDYVQGYIWGKPMSIKEILG